MTTAKTSATGAPALVLFDIDGTLIRRAGPHHRQALVDAVRHVTGLETTTDPEVLDQTSSRDQPTGDEIDGLRRALQALPPNQGRALLLRE